MRGGRCASSMPLRWPHNGSQPAISLQRLNVPASADEIGRLAGTFNNMIARLETSFRQIRQFSSDASHELRTPLTVMKGETELALRRPRKRPTTPSCWKAIWKRSTA